MYLAQRGVSVNLSRCALSDILPSPVFALTGCVCALPRAFPFLVLVFTLLPLSSLTFWAADSFVSLSMDSLSKDACTPSS